MFKNQCDGHCSVEGTCKGDVKRVVVSGGHWAAQKFNYCAEAIRRDKASGFTVLKTEDE